MMPKDYKNPRSPDSPTQIPYTLCNMEDRQIPQPHLHVNLTHGNHGVQYHQVHQSHINVHLEHGVQAHKGGQLPISVPDGYPWVLLAIPDITRSPLFDGYSRPTGTRGGPTLRPLSLLNDRLPLPTLQTSIMWAETKPPPPDLLCPLNSANRVFHEGWLFPQTCSSKADRASRLIAYC